MKFETKVMSEMKGAGVSCVNIFLLCTTSESEKCLWLKFETDRRLRKYDQGGENCRGGRKIVLKILTQLQQKIEARVLISILQKLQVGAA